MARSKRSSSGPTVDYKTNPSTGMTPMDAPCDAALEGSIMGVPGYRSYATGRPMIAPPFPRKAPGR